MRILGVTIASQVLDHGQLQFPGYFHHLFASKHHLPALRGCDIHCTTAAFKWGNQGNRNIEYLCLHLFICYFASALQLIQKTRTWWWSLGLQAAEVNPIDVFGEWDHRPRGRWGLITVYLSKSTILCSLCLNKPEPHVCKFLKLNILIYINHCHHRKVCNSVNRGWIHELLVYM